MTEHRPLQACRLGWRQSRQCLRPDAEQLCGKRHQRHADRQGHRWWLVSSEIGWHGGKAAIGRPRVRQRGGAEAGASELGGDAEGGPAVALGVQPDADRCGNALYQPPVSATCISHLYQPPVSATCISHLHQPPVQPVYRDDVQHDAQSWCKGCCSARCSADWMMQVTRVQVTGWCRWLCERCRLTHISYIPRHPANSQTVVEVGMMRP
jgi:hypothetical protein